MKQRFINKLDRAGVHIKNPSEIVESKTFKRTQSNTDRAGKKSISYWYVEDETGGFGYARDFKTGAETTFASSHKDDGTFSTTDRQRMQAMFQQKKAEQAAEITRLHCLVAEKAAVKFAQASTDGTTPYCTAKGIRKHSARVYGKNTLFIPIYEGYELVSWQYIYSDGTKRFPFGGKKMGCFHIIGDIKPDKPVALCEGFATGASIHEATGLPVIVAFDAGNLYPALKTFRKNHDNHVIICADNDQNRVGQTKGFEISKKDKNTSLKTAPHMGTDFNDIDREQIISIIGHDGGNDENMNLNPSYDVSPKETTLSIVPADHSPEVPEEYPTKNETADWQDDLSLDQKMNIVPNSLRNAILFIQNHHELKGIFSYDEFRRAEIIVRCPPWEYERNFQIKELDQVVIAQCTAWLEGLGIKITTAMAMDAIRVASHENSFHPARNYFRSLRWDGVARLDTWLKEYLNVSDRHNAEYLAEVGKKWLTAGVNRVFEAGCKFDHMIVLESEKQGLYKSTALRELATFGGVSYHTDSVSLAAITDKDNLSKLRGCLIVELAEMDGFEGARSGAVKNWISLQEDRMRKPYARSIESFPRQFIFAGTTNETEYLKDATGNRRFWSLTVTKAIDIDKLNAVKDQLWAEAVHEYEGGLYLGLSPEMEKVAEKERDKNTTTDAWDDIVLKAVAKTRLDEFRVQDVMEAMGLKTYEQNATAVRRIGDILRTNGFTNAARWDSKRKKSVRTWAKGE